MKWELIFYVHRVTKLFLFSLLQDLLDRLMIFVELKGSEVKAG
jgi:hypothetical protein